MRLFFREHNSSGSMLRVWREDWSGDQFEIMTRDNLENLREIGRPFGISIVEAEDLED